MMTRRLRFRVPREEETQKTSARRYVHRAWPEGTHEQITALFSAARVEADEVVVTRPDRPLAPETVVEIEMDEKGRETFGLPEVESLLWDDDWIIVDKPVGIPGRLTDDDPMDPIRFMADMLGIDRDGFTPVWEMPATAGGPWLIARSADCSKDLATQITSGPVHTTWMALTTRPGQGQGQWQTSRGALGFAVTRAEGGLAELQLTPKWQPSEDGSNQPFFAIMQMCAEAGFPILGDAIHGGYLVGGGTRLRLNAIFGTVDFAHSWPAPRDWWPEEPVTPPPVIVDKTSDEVGKDSSGKRSVGKLEVSNKTVEIVIGGGHPWVLHDRHTGSVDEMKPGDPVELVSPAGSSGVYALVDGTGPIVARVWSDDREEAASLDEEIEIRLDEAIGSRRQLFREMGSTDVFRVVHAEADGMPGLYVDRVGPVWRVVTAGRCARGYREKIYELLQWRDESAMILEVEHLRDLRRQDHLPKARIVAKGDAMIADGEDLIVREDGLRYRIEPWKGIDIGFFADQRDNRRRAVERAESDERWLNLFCHTGAFSTALARAGVHTTNVDLSRRYLRWLDTNFELNSLSLDLRENHSVDARTFLHDTDQKFDGIIVDPPTAATGEDGFWSVRDDYQKLLSRCFQVLEQGGSMLVCRNDKKARTPLKELVLQAAEEAGRDLEVVESAPPAADFPTLKGFPEGTKFEGVWVQ